MSMPIVVMHLGYHPYVPYVLEQARRSNPDSAIYVLGDKEGLYDDSVTWRHVLTYRGRASEFSKNYKHMSCNPYAYELFCFQRWFILHELMKQESITRCLHLDSDVLLFASLDEESPKFASYGMTMSYASCAHNSYMSIDALSEFCEFLLSLYIDPAKFSMLQKVYDDFVTGKNANPVSDMTGLLLYCKEHRDTVGETTTIIDGTCYDHNLNMDEGYETVTPNRADPARKIKMIEWRDGYPWCRRVREDRWVRFNTLHFQGAAKEFIPKMVHHAVASTRAAC